MACFLIGLDGATFDVIDPMIKKGKLPNIKFLIRNGSSAVLKATHPPSTFPGWPTIATGINPGKHGVYGFFNPENRFPMVNKKVSISQADYINKRMRSVPNLWDELGKKYKITLINYPGTYPAKKINGFMVTGLLTPSVFGKNFTYPTNLAEKIKSKVPGYKIDAKFQVEKKKALEDTNNVAKKRFELLKMFLNENGSDFYCVVFTSLDRIQHYLWGSKEVEKHYELLDKFLGELLRKNKDDNFVIVSDHGFQRNSKYFYVNSWLQDNGFLYVKDENKLSRSSIMRKLGLKKQNVLKLLKLLRLTKLLKLLPMKFKGIIPENKTSIEEVQVDWKKTKAYATYSIENGIYINLKGREPFGSVAKKDYEALRGKIIKALMRDYGLECMKKEDIYSGEFLPNLPDIVINFPDNLKFNSCLTKKVVEDVNHDKTEEPLGSHHIDGLFMAYGKNIASKKHRPLNQVDIFPTLLHMLGMPVPDNVDGRVATEIFSEDSELKKRKVKKTKGKKSIINSIRI
ncbi:MAG: alkaline phosphatase family protein [Nanobdellota archaeon]